MKKRDIICPHCHALNPPKAYVCVKCYKVIYEKYRVPFWKVEFSSLTRTLLISLTVFITLVYLLNKWFASVEAEMSVKVQTAEYNLSVAAEKARKKGEFDLTKTTAPVQIPSTKK